MSNSSIETAAIGDTGKLSTNDINVTSANLVFQGQVIVAASANVSADEDVTLRRGSPDDDNSFVRTPPAAAVR